MSLVHTHGDGHPGRGGYSGDQPDRGTQSEQVGGDAGDEPETPDRRVQEDQHADAGDAEAGCGKQDRVQAPGQAVVEVVDESGLAGRRQCRFLDAGEGEDLAPGQAVVRAAVSAGLVLGPARRRQARMAPGGPTSRILTVGVYRLGADPRLLHRPPP